jgi:diguanylate cyclase (GGDEF)-like protein
MKDNIRYSEFVFLSALLNRDPNFQYVWVNRVEQQTVVGLDQMTYLEMIISLAESLCVEFDQQPLQQLVGRLRGEIPVSFPRPSQFHDFEWANPREALRNRMIGQLSYSLRVTYQGRCRLEDLREELKRERTVEPFGVLLDIRYFERDLEEALHLPDDVPVSVLRLDLDKFKPVNDEYGHKAGDEVMKSYLSVVRDSLGSIGTAYRGRGDEVAVLIMRQEHQRVVQIAERIRDAIASMRCPFEGQTLPPVTASIGVATSPPGPRGRELEDLADSRQSRAKKEGRNRVIAS